MSNFLAVDTSSRYLTALAAKDGKIALRFISDCAMKHSVTLMGEIDRAMEEVNLTPSECDFFCAVTGPGSFTGIRIGVSAVKGFALGAGKKTLALTSFELLAYNVKDEKFYTVIDAAHNHYYVCGFDRDKNVLLEPSYMSGEQVSALGAKLYGFEDLPFDNYTRLDAGKCLYPAVCANEHRLTDDIHALYVRKSQAEEGRK